MEGKITLWLEGFACCLQELAQYCSDTCTAGSTLAHFAVFCRTMSESCLGKERSDRQALASGAAAMRSEVGRRAVACVDCAAQYFRCALPSQGCCAVPQVAAVKLVVCA